MNINNWREIDEKDIKEFVDNITKEFIERREVGIKKYGKTFVGEPVRHQYEELLDALFYNWAISQEKEYSLEKIESMRTDLANCILFLSQYSRTVKTDELKNIIDKFIQDLIIKNNLRELLEINT